MLDVLNLVEDCGSTKFSGSGTGTATIEKLYSYFVTKLSITRVLCFFGIIFSTFFFYLFFCSETLSESHGNF
eukprot:SAG11_NODE_1820_length_4211_cov_6.308852_2_plen_72_part_00